MNRPRRYILAGQKPVPCEDLFEWGEWMASGDRRRVAETMVGKVWISTVFLGLDHQFGNSPPVLFETMAFKKRGTNPRSHQDLDQQRCSTWLEGQEATQTDGRKVSGTKQDKIKMEA